MTTDRSDLAQRARQLLDLHRRGDPLVLVNAWDVASAKVIEAAGTHAIATTSAAIAAVFGEPDDDLMDVDLCSTPSAGSLPPHRCRSPPTSKPATGWRPPSSSSACSTRVPLAATSRTPTIAGRASRSTPAPSPSGSRTIRAAAATAGVDVVLNARIDTLFHGDQGPDAIADVLALGRRYAAAGADCVYPIRLADPGSSPSWRRRWARRSTRTSRPSGPSRPWPRPARRACPSTHRPTVPSWPTSPHTPRRCCTERRTPLSR